MERVRKFASFITPEIFFGIDRRSLELFRLCVCLWTFRDLIARFDDLEAFHCETGLLNDPSFRRNKLWLHKVMFWRGSLELQCVLFILHFIVTVLMFIGYKVKLTSFLHFLFTISLHERNHYICSGADKLFRHLSFWCAILPTLHYTYYYKKSDKKSDKKIDKKIDSVKNIETINEKLTDSNNNETKTSNTLRKRHTSVKSNDNERNNESNNSMDDRDDKYNCKYYSGYAAMGILFNSFIIYPFVMIRRMSTKDGKWKWSDCSALHISLARFDMVDPQTNIALYFSGMYPRGCFYLCRIVGVMEWILAPTLFIVSLLPFADMFDYYQLTNNERKFLRYVKKFQLFLTFCICLMHVGFAIAFRLQNFVLSGCLSMIPFIPSYFWDEFFIIVKLNELIEFIVSKFNLKYLINAILIDKNKISSVPAQQTLLYQFFGIFWFFYSIMNICGDLGLIYKPDEGNIGEFFRLHQNWNMFVSVSDVTRFMFLVGNIETDGSDAMSLQLNDTQIVINDLIVSYYEHAQIYDGDREFVKGKNRRSFNPVSYSKSRKWERMIRRADKKDALKKSVMDYFCRKSQLWSPMGVELRRYERTKDNSSESIIESYNVNITKFSKVGYCMYSARVESLWKQPGGQSHPTYRSEKVNCTLWLDCA